MATDVKLPEIGEGVTEGEMVQWLVKVGDSIDAEQSIAEVMTDKATVEVPSPVAGVVKELNFKEGDVVNVGDTMMTLDGAGAAPSPPKTETPKAAPPETPTPAVAAAPATPAAAPASNGGLNVFPPVADVKVLATPSTRRLARELTVDINRIQGTGLAGRVTREDVLKSVKGAGALSAGPASFQQPSIARPAYNSPEGAVEERVPMRGIRKKIAENMQMSKHIIPHFTLMDEANVTELVHLRSELKDDLQKQGVKITYLPFIMKALIATIREFPMVNASIDDEAKEIVYKKYFNLGFAADTPNGLMVPVIKNAEHKTVLELAQEIVDLAMKARDGKLQLDEMKGSTVTITNIGAIGGTYATPIINHPEVAILGLYKITDKPIMAPNGDIAFIKSMNFTITADHRLIDGAVAANFLKAFIQRIENPGKLMLDMM